MSCGIQVRELKKSYRPYSLRAAETVEAVKGVSFEVGHGDVFGLIGPSGCGKSTIAKILAGLIEPDSGIAKIRGRLGFVSQDPYSSLSPVMRVGTIVSEPLLFGGHARRHSDCTEAVRNAMARVRLGYGQYKNRLPSELSGGERQRVAIARALIGNPGVLILDEPVSMLDYDVKLEVIEILRELASDSEYAILLISHDIGFVRNICTHMAVMESGLIIEEGEPAGLCKNPRHVLTRKLVLASMDLNGYLRQS